MTIVTFNPTSNFTRIGNDVLRDERLSFEARGMLCYLRSMPPDWKVMPTQLAKHGKSGRERISRILNELIAAGYIEKTLSRDPATQKWKAADYTVFAVRNAPEPVADEAAREIISEAQRVADEPAAPPLAPKADAEKPSTAKPPLLTTDQPTTESTKSKNLDREARPSDHEIDQVFEQDLWPAYPQRSGDQGEDQARKKFRAIVKASADPQATAEQIITAVSVFAAYWADKVERKPEEAQFIPKAKNWLHNGEYKNPPRITPRAETIFDIVDEFARRAAEREPQMAA